jgi:hypothetical protein
MYLSLLHPLLSMDAFMGLHRAVILVLRVLSAREEMRLPERQKTLARLQWSKIQILRKRSELFDASNHAFCYALRIVLNHRYVLLYWPHTSCARRPWETRAIHHVLFLPLPTRKRVVHAEYA